jgi:hypothetical protein
MDTVQQSLIYLTQAFETQDKELRKKAILDFITLTKIDTHKYKHLIGGLVKAATEVRRIYYVSLIASAKWDFVCENFKTNTCRGPIKNNRGFINMLNKLALRQTPGGIKQFYCFDCGFPPEWLESVNPQSKETNAELPLWKNKHSL